MTLQKAKSMARRLGLTLRLLRSSKYRVTSAMGREQACYAVDIADAVNTAVEMAQRPSS
jgi:hypothetical protein